VISRMVCVMCDEEKTCGASCEAQYDDGVWCAVSRIHMVLRNSDVDVLCLADVEVHE